MDALLIIGDAVDVMADPPTIVRPAMVLTDPPFDISNDANKSNDWNGYTSNKGEWDKQVDSLWVPLAYELLTDSGIFACFGVFGSLVSVYIELTQLGALFQSHAAYTKTNPAPSIQRRMYTHANELVLIYSKGAGWTYNYQDAKELAGGKQLKNIFDAPVVRRVMGRTIKHHSVLKKLILPLTNEGDYVLDPFCGTCSIGAEALALGRNYIGIDNDPHVVYYGAEQLSKLGAKVDIYEPIR